MIALHLSPADVGREFVCRNGAIARIDSPDPEGNAFHKWRGIIAGVCGYIYYGDSGRAMSTGEDWDYDLIARADEPAPRGEEPVAEYGNRTGLEWIDVQQRIADARVALNQIERAIVAARFHPPADNVRDQGEVRELVGMLRRCDEFLGDMHALSRQATCDLSVKLKADVEAALAKFKEPGHG